MTQLSEIKTGAFEQEKCIEHLLINGAYAFHAPDLAKQVDLSHVKWIEQKESTPFYWAPGDDYLSEVFSEYERLFLKQVFHRFVRVKTWYCNGVEDTTREWHTDLKEKINLSILAYLCDTDPQIGGAISVRSNGNGIILYPKFGDVIFLMHTPGFEHRADPSLRPRHYINSTYKKLEM